MGVGTDHRCIKQRGKGSSAYGRTMNRSPLPSKAKKKQNCRGARYASTENTRIPQPNFGNILTAPPTPTAGPRRDIRTQKKDHLAPHAETTGSRPQNPLHSTCSRQISPIHLTHDDCSLNHSHTDTHSLAHSLPQIPSQAEITSQWILATRMCADPQRGIITP